MKCYLSNNGLDIKVITNFLNTKGIYPDNAYTVAELYHDFCSDEYCACWLVLSSDTLEYFAKWIKERWEKQDERIKHLCD